MIRAPSSALAAALALVALAPGAAAQQQMRTETSLLLGPAPYDLLGSGTGFAARLSGASRLSPRGVLLIEPSVGYFTYVTKFGGRSQWIFPELGLEAEARVGRARPYLGTGIGAGFETRAGPNQVEFTMHAAGGVRLRFGGSWGARIEMRLRSVHPWQGETADLGLGITRGIY
jgi:hypothetical protein